MANQILGKDYDSNIECSGHDNRHGKGDISVRERLSQHAEAALAARQSHRQHVITRKRPPFLVPKKLEAVQNFIRRSFFLRNNLPWHCIFNSGQCSFCSPPLQYYNDCFCQYFQIKPHAPSIDIFTIKAYDLFEISDLRTPRNLPHTSYAWFNAHANTMS